MAFTLSGDAATTRTNLGLGDAATKTTGTASGNIPVLDSSGQIADAQIAALSVSKLSGVGTTGQVLTSTGTTTAPTMQDAAGGGKVLQVVQQSFTGTADTREVDNNFVDTGITVNITPSSPSSKVLVQVYIGKSGCDAASRTTNFRLVRAGVNISIGDLDGSRTRGSFATGCAYTDEGQTASMNYLDSPNTTSSTTYKIMWSGHNGDLHSLNYGGANGNYDDSPHSRSASSIIVMEIGA